MHSIGKSGFRFSNPDFDALRSFSAEMDFKSNLEFHRFVIFASVFGGNPKRICKTVFVRSGL